MDLFFLSYNFNLLINLNFNVKLDDTNYLIWKEQLMHVVIVYDLQAFLDGFKVSPSRVVKKSISIVDKDSSETHA